MKLLNLGLLSQNRCIVTEELMTTTQKARYITWCHGTLTFIICFVECLGFVSTSTVNKGEECKNVF